MVKKTGKILVCMFVVLLLLLQTSEVILAKITNHAAGATGTFGISLLHTSSYLDGSANVTMGYRVDGKNAYRVYYGNNDYESTILCLDKSGRFPKATDAGGNMNQGNYTSLGESTAANLKTAKASIDADRAAKINWLVSNALLPEDSEDLQKQKISEIFNALITSTQSDVNPVTANQIRHVLTQDDIVFALQLAIWNLTNNNTPSNIQGTYDGSFYDSLTGNNIFSYSGVKGEYILHMYRYYVQHWGDQVSAGGTNPVVSKPETDNTTQTLDYFGAFVYVGPFKIDAATNDYTVDISFKDAEEHDVPDVSYKLTSTNDGQGVIYSPTKAGVNGKEFYVRLRANSTARSVTVKAIPKIIASSSQGYVWTDGVAGDQPLLTIVREETPVNPSQKTIKFTVNPRERKFDAALRKYIVGYNRYATTGVYAGNWVHFDVTGSESRVPVVSKTLSKEAEYNDYSYVHRKDPYVVQVGDIVEYEIRVYNECEEKMVVEQITDHLPPIGLKVITDRNNPFWASNEDNGWQYNSDANSLVTNKTRSVELQEKGDAQDSAHVRLWLEVTDDAVGRVITNIAEITQYRCIPDHDEFDNPNEDKDSGFSSTDEDHKIATLPSSEPDWESYQGFYNNVGIDTRDYWFKGQEDDDDFEKITVPDDGKIDLALRKSIYEVSGNQKSREVAPDTTPLINNTNSTSNFNDDKSVVNVQPGDKIKYRIRVFNIVSSSGNTTLGEIENAAGNFTKNEFSTSVSSVESAQVVLGKATIRTEKLKDEKLINFESNNQRLDIHSVEVVCVVLDTLENDTVIKNISAITEYLDKDKQPTTPDEDSDTTTPINPDTYPNNDHIQDDDDYEPIKITTTPKAYDLALKKFITQVKSENGTVKTLPEAQRRYCEVANTDSLKNREGTERATAEYNLNKTTVAIENNDTIIYTIRIFNEGAEDAKVTQIVDTVPDGLAFITNSQINIDNGWQTFNDQTSSGWKVGIVTDKLAGVTIPKFDKTQSNGENKEKGLSYRDIQVEFKVDLDSLTENQLEEVYNHGMKNIAEITADDGDDVDSTPNAKDPEEDDQDYDIVIPPNPSRFDLALKKYIVTINDGETVPNRFRGLDSSNLADGGTDATYDLDKSVIKVKSGKKVVYTIRVFNEGSIDGYVKQLRDDLPEGLSFVPRENSEINTRYGWEERDGQIWTTYLENELIKAYDSNNRTTNEQNQIIDGVSYKEVQVELLMTSKDPTKTIVNQAEITRDNNSQNKEDPDSDPNNNNPREDDQDYDNIIPAVYDLALKKSIAQVIDSSGNVKTIPEDQKRGIKVINTDSLINRGPNADAQYELNKTPVHVANGDSVVYTIRVFNEGQVDAKVLELVDRVPAGLTLAKYETNTDGTYKSGSKINHKYGWKKVEGVGRVETGEGSTSNSSENGNEITNTNNENTASDLQNESLGAILPSMIKTDYLKDKVIPAFDETKANGENKEKGLSYIDVQVEFIVDLDLLKEADGHGNYNEAMTQGLKNIAEITEDDGDDSDSTPDNQDPDEDDEDYDIVIPKEFDLALRKFITKINNKEITTRIPEVTYNGNEIQYSHPKDPLVVVKGQIVIYTIRVYNEGSQNGYAAEVSDDLPEGITFLPNNSVNTKYRWVMLDSSGNVTTDVKKAKKIRTDYLSKEQESKAGANLLKAFDPTEPISDKNPDYRDLQVAFEVTKEDPTVEPRVITNTAEITDDTDEYGNKVEDKDSIPNNGDEIEDDIDVEHIELKYFDLSLLKYVKEVIVTEDGHSKTITTNYDGTENPEPVVKVELNRKKLSTTEVRYVYTIKITNEGEIEGYAKEITDRIPDGLAFNEEDNTQWHWKVKEPGIVTTDYLADKLLKPGESAEVPIVLRWIKDANNLGQKVNVAEISKDENEYGVPDVDSTPNNNKEGEDDQDNAIVVLTITTGASPIYMTLITTVIAMIGTGIYLIKKYVL